MYPRLTKLIGRFICLDLANGSNILRYSGCLTEILPEYFTLITYKDDGTKECEFSGLTKNIIGLFVDHQDEQVLAAKVSMAATVEGGKSA